MRIRGSGVVLRPRVAGRAAAVLAALLLIASAATPAAAAPAEYTYFAYDSTPGSWVGAGRTDYFVSPDGGWTFTAGSGQGGAYVRLGASRLPDPTRSDYYWDLDLLAPGGQRIAPGLYENAERYPFQGAGRPGMWLSGNHRGDNVIAGHFRVLEAEYGPGNTVTRFAVDFRQYDEGNPNQWVEGQFRYHSTLPEPSALLALAVPVVSLLLRRRTRG